MPKSVFRILSLADFINYIRHATFQRKVTFIQNHHTWKPDYNTFYHSGFSAMSLLENMRHDHIKNRGWNDIGQNITIFPDGKIGLCRAIDITPAGIAGANTAGICIESMGNFDLGGDVMTAEQKEAIVKTNAMLCIKYGLQPNFNHVVYHHWYNRAGKRQLNSFIDSGEMLKQGLQKTCPGTNFFKPVGSSVVGNTVQCAIANFFPLVAAAIAQLQEVPVTVLPVASKKVTTDKLNVRAGRSVDFRVVRQLPKGLQVPVYDTANNWSRISINAEEWVSSKFLS